MPSSSAARAARCSPASPGRFSEASTVGRTCSHASPSSSFARGSPHFEEFFANTSRRRSSRWKDSSTQNTYAFQSTVPASRCGALSTRRRHEPTSRDVSISSGLTFLRPIRSGSDFSALRTGRPSGVAPKSTTRTRSARKGRTVGNRVTSIDRHAASASESIGGASSNSAAIAAASSSRGTTSSIRSHIAVSVATSGGLISPDSVSTCSLVVSNTTRNAVASLIPARSILGSVFSFCFAVSRSARASSFVAISTSSRSSASSTALDVR